MEPGNGGYRPHSGAMACDERGVLGLVTGCQSTRSGPLWTGVRLMGPRKGTEWWSHRPRVLLPASVVEAIPGEIFPSPDSRYQTPP